MPLLSIESNITLPDQETLKYLSEITATLLGKPEAYVLVKYEHNENMLFAGNNEPLALVKLKSLGLPETQTAEYSAKICNALSEVLKISAQRIYIEFSAPARHLWGWNGGTF